MSPPTRARREGSSASDPRALAIGVLCLGIGCAADSPPRIDLDRRSGAPSAPAPAGTPAGVASSPEILSIDPWRFGQADGFVIRTTHYRVFTTAENAVLRTRMAAFLEHALAHYRTALVPLPPPPARLDTYLMNNRPQWQNVTKQLMAEQADQLLRIPRGGYASRGIGVFYDIGLFDTLAIAAHESWHQYTQRTFKDALPVWLEEGMATFMEGHRWEPATPQFLAWANTERFDQLRKARSADTLIPLGKLLESRPQDFLDRADDAVLTYYAQLWALVHFLNEGADGKYSAPLREAVADASSGGMRRVLTLKLGERAAGSVLMQRTGPGVFLAYFNMDLDAAAAEYAGFLDLVVQTGSRGLIVAGRSPLARPAPASDR